MTNSCRPGARAPLPAPRPTARAAPHYQSRAHYPSRAPLPAPRPTTVAVRHRLGPAPGPNVGTVGTALQAWATDLAVVPTA